MNEMNQAIFLFKSNEIYCVATTESNKAIICELLEKLKNDFALLIHANGIVIRSAHADTPIVPLFKEKFNNIPIKYFLAENNDIEYYAEELPNRSINIFWIDKRYPNRQINVSEDAKQYLAEKNLDMYLKLDYDQNLPNFFTFSYSMACQSLGINLLEILQTLILFPEQANTIRSLIQVRLNESRSRIIADYLNQPFGPVAANTLPSRLLTPLQQNIPEASFPNRNEPEHPSLTNDLSENEDNTSSAASDMSDVDTRRILDFAEPPKPDIKELLKSSLITFRNGKLDILPSAEDSKTLYEELVKTNMFIVYYDDINITLSSLPTDPLPISLRFAGAFQQEKVYYELVKSPRIEYYFYGDPTKKIYVTYTFVNPNHRAAIIEELEGVIQAHFQRFLRLKRDPYNNMGFSLYYKYAFNDKRNAPLLSVILKTMIEHPHMRQYLHDLICQHYQIDIQMSQMQNNVRYPDTATRTQDVVNIAPTATPNNNNNNNHNATNQIHLKYSALNILTKLDKSVDLAKEHRKFIPKTLVFTNGVKLNPDYYNAINWEDTYHKGAKVNPEHNVGTLTWSDQHLSVCIYSIWRVEHRLIILTRDDSYPEVPLNSYYKLLEHKEKNLTFRFIDDQPVGPFGLKRKWKNHPEKKNNFFKALDKLNGEFTLLKPADYHARTAATTATQQVQQVDTENMNRQTNHHA